eukprot:460432-Rhodomonas_salina.3
MIPWRSLVPHFAPKVFSLMTDSDGGALGAWGRRRGRGRTPAAWHKTELEDIHLPLSETDMLPSLSRPHPKARWPAAVLYVRAQGMARAALASAHLTACPAPRCHPAPAYPFRILCRARHKRTALNAEPRCQTAQSGWGAGVAGCVLFPPSQRLALARTQPDDATCGASGLKSASSAALGAGRRLRCQVRGTCTDRADKDTACAWMRRRAARGQRPKGSPACP